MQILMLPYNPYATEAAHRDEKSIFRMTALETASVGADTELRVVTPVCPAHIVRPW